MSTDYNVFKREGTELEIVESSSRFRIYLTQKGEHFPDGVFQLSIPDDGALTAEEVVDIAIKLIHPTLYGNTPDSKKFQQEIIKKIEALPF